MDYTGIKCPVCEKTFTKQDDVVVCPECGAPYHRGCYQKEGHCIFEEKHQKGESWQTPSRKKGNASTERGNMLLPSLRQRKQPVFPFLRSLWNVAFRRSSWWVRRTITGNSEMRHRGRALEVPSRKHLPNHPTGFPQGSFFGGGPLVLGPYGGSKSQRTY